MGRPPPERGPSVSAFEVFQDVRQVCGVVAAELFEEVDFDVHWGFLSLSFPFVVPPFYQPPPPVSSPSGVSFATFPGTVGYRTVGQRGPSFSYVHVTYPGGTYTQVSYRGVTYHQVTLPQRNLLLRSSNLRLRR